ncbi:MAG: molybdopterin molybdenumtransferase MoeA, partial [Boseongicola sp.]|nr:molybdopterin molybdenumtransferase MoeA [Boseongicola sp.]
MARSISKIAKRPGQPLMAGRMDGTPMIGLPGNPVSAMVCGHVFLRPAVRALQGLAKEALPTRSMPLAAPLSANGPRAHYMRAAIAHGSVTAASRQDSALLTVLASADALIVRPPQDGPRDTGETVQIIDI